MIVNYKEVNSFAELIDAFCIRVDIFIIEQGKKIGWEPGEEDKKSRHFIAITNGKIVSTLRIRESSPGEIKIERMATKKDYRNKGISKGLITYVLKEINITNPKKIWIEAQVKAQGFYEKCGFKITSKPYNPNNTGLHVRMTYNE